MHLHQANNRTAADPPSASPFPGWACPHQVVPSDHKLLRCEHLHTWGGWGGQQLLVHRAAADCMVLLLLLSLTRFSSNCDTASGGRTASAVFLYMLWIAFFIAGKTGWHRNVG